MLVLPILDLNATLKYKSGPYHVMVLCESDRVYVDSLLLGEYEQCSCDEIETAVRTLACFVKGVAEASVGLSDEVISKIKPAHEQAKIRRVHQELLREPSVKVPFVKANIRTRKTRVTKLLFSNKEPGTHQETGPFLLFTKAAVIWSAKQGEKLLPGCPLPPVGCEVCAADNLTECLCEAFDPSGEVPSEINVEIN